MISRMHLACLRAPQTTRQNTLGNVIDRCDVQLFSCHEGSGIFNFTISLIPNGSLLNVKHLFVSPNLKICSTSSSCRRAAITSTPKRTHVAHVHSIEHRNREQYPLLTGGNFWIYVVMGVRYGLVGLVPVFEMGTVGRLEKRLEVLVTRALQKHNHYR